jgi:hypothetical protein
MVKFKKYKNDLDIAYLKIQTGEKEQNIKDYGMALGVLAQLVEDLLNSFYSEQITSFSEDDQQRIKDDTKKIEGPPFGSSSLGRKMAILRTSSFIEKVEEKNNKYLEKLKQLRDGRFVEIRNSTTHINETKKHQTIDKGLAIEQFDLIVSVLKELGYEELYDFRTHQYANFLDEFEKAAHKHSTRLDPKFIIDEGLLSEFICNSKSVNLIDEIRQSNNNFIVIGEGGIGKSTIMRYICNKFNEFNGVKRSLDEFRKCPTDFSPIPIIISASHLKIASTTYVLNDFLHDISKVNSEPFDILGECNTLIELSKGIIEESNRPFFILLLDGFNEIYSINEGVYDAFIPIYEELSKNRVQIVISSRTNILPADRKSSFKEVLAKGLNEHQILSYIQSTGTQDDIKTLLKDKRIFDILKNPMLLMLHTKYQSQFENILDSIQNNPEEVEQKNNLEFLIDQKSLCVINSKKICRSYILWNYVQYLLYNNVFRPLSEGKQQKRFSEWEKNRLQESRVWTISKLIPEFAWQLVSNGLFEVDYSEKIFEDQINAFCKSTKKSFSSEEIQAFQSEITDFLIINTGLLKCEKDAAHQTASISFSHQVFRDFFAACYYIKGTLQLSGQPVDELDLCNQLKSNYIPSDVKVYVGELLNELEVNETPGQPLRNILKEYQNKDCSELASNKENNDSADLTVENIFEIYKALGTLNPSDFIKTGFDKLNFNDLSIDKIISFVEETLDNISMDDLINEVKPFGKKEEHGTLLQVKNLFMLSLHCANNSRASDIRRFYKVWLQWAKDVYNNKTETHAKSLWSKSAYLLLSNKKLTASLLTTVGYRFLENENWGIGETSFTDIFKEVSEAKSDYQSIMEILAKNGQGIDNTRISAPMYRLASSNGYASNFACFVLNYYLYYNLDGGFDLVEKLKNQMDIDTDPERKIMIKFRMLSGMNYCVQESWCQGRTNQADLKNTFRPLMTEFLESELDAFLKAAKDYREFKYGYYFPFGILFLFDNGIDDNQTTEKAFARIFQNGDFDLALCQKVLLDIACSSITTFSVQNEVYADAQGCGETNNGRYLGKTFEFLEKLILKLYSANSNDVAYDQETAIEESLLEALAILYCNYPLKTERFLDRINSKFLENNATKKSKVLSLKNKLKRFAKEEEFKQLCAAGLNGKKFKIFEFVENYKNVLAFADLANNVFISIPKITQTLVVWGENSFFKNIDDYGKNPKKFVNQTIKEVISILERD